MNVGKLECRLPPVKNLQLSRMILAGRCRVRDLMFAFTDRDIYTGTSWIVPTIRLRLLRKEAGVLAGSRLAFAECLNGHYQQQQSRLRVTNLELWLAKVSFDERHRLPGGLLRDNMSRETPTRKKRQANQSTTKECRDHEARYQTYLDVARNDVLLLLWLLLLLFALPFGQEASQNCLTRDRPGELIHPPRTEVKRCRTNMKEANRHHGEFSQRVRN